MVFRAFRKTVKTPKERRFLPCTVPAFSSENALPRGGNSGWSFRRFWGRRDPQTATAGAGLKPAPAVGNYLKDDALPLILKLKIVNIHGVPVGNAHFLQTGEQTHLAELLVKIVP